jgi:hypothetical protein
MSDRRNPQLKNIWFIYKLVRKDMDVNEHERLYIQHYM